MTFADPIERAHLIRGFRGLMDYLKSIPELPAPIYSTVHVFRGKRVSAMSPVIVLVGVGVMAVSAAATLAVLIIGIHRADRPGRRHLADAPRSHSEAFARRLLLGVRYPTPPTEPESAREEMRRWPGK